MADEHKHVPDAPKKFPDSDNQRRIAAVGETLRSTFYTGSTNEIPDDMLAVVNRIR